MIFSELNSFLTLADKTKNLFSPKKEKRKESVASRFFKIFESHGVHRNQIPRFFGHGLLISDVQDEGTLLPKLDEIILQRVCEKFAIRREWLDGADDEIYPLHHFYKDPGGFISFIEEIKDKNPDSRLVGVLVSSDSKLDTGEAFIALEEHIGRIEDRPIYRTHLCPGWPMPYWKARGYLTACIASAWKRKVYIRGARVSSAMVNKYCDGEEFICWSMSQYGGGATSFVGKRWYPEEMTEKVATYLDGVDEGKFGKSAALGLWLDLYKNGLMDTGYGTATEIVKVFQAELNQNLS